METLGIRLARLREQAGMNQVEVAAAIPVEIGRSYISKIERDRGIPSWEVLCALADLYDVGLDYLRFGDSISSLKPTRLLIQDPGELALIRVWRAMTDEEKRGFVMFTTKFTAQST